MVVVVVVEVVFVWPRVQASLGSPQPPLPWDGHARPSSIEDHLDRDREYFKDRILEGPRTQLSTNLRPPARAGSFEVQCKILWGQNANARARLDSTLAANGCSSNTILVLLQ